MPAKILRYLTIAFLVVFGLLTLMTIPVRSTSSAIHSFDASFRQEEFILGFRVKSKIRRSVLSRWLEEHGEPFAPRWKHVSTVNYNVFNSVISRGCSTIGPIYHLSNATICSEVIKHSTEKEILDFVEIMRSGDQEHQQAAVESVLEQSWARR